LEIIALMCVDIRHAFTMWRSRGGGGGRLLTLWRVPYYWWSRTARSYVVMMYWKLKQLLLLSLGLWTQETVEAFGIREKVGGKEGRKEGAGSSKCGELAWLRSLITSW